MNSFIYIDKVVFVASVLIFLVVGLTEILIGCCNIRLNQENERLRNENKKLKSELSITQDKFYKATFKVPDIDEDYQVVEEKAK